MRPFLNNRFLPISRAFILVFQGKDECQGDIYQGDIYQFFRVKALSFRLGMKRFFLDFYLKK